MDAAGAGPVKVTGEKIVYAGLDGQFTGIHIVNLLLTLITAGIYRFWSRTRERKYVWAHTAVLGDHLEAAAAAAKIPHKRGGTYLCMEGPQFSTQAESFLYKSWGCHVIGMTNMPEAKLAREAELCYATVAMVTDFDCWHPDHDHVEVSAIVKVLLDNAAKAQDVVRGAVPAIAAARPAVCPKGCDHALENALITAPEARDPALLAKLDAVAGRVLKR